jgi:Ca2+-binding RTX toxin-like protein
VLGGTLTAQAVDGVATFSGLTLDIAGTYTIDASDSTDGAATIASNSFVVSAAAASQLVWATQPHNGTTGVTLSAAAVDVEDEFGNTVDSTATIALSIATGPGALVGTTSVQAVAGVATYNNLALTTPGSYTLAASASSLSAATSTAFTVSAPTATFVTLVSGNLFAQGTAGPDTIALTTSGSNLIATLNGLASQPFALAAINSITVDGASGNDLITLGPGIPAASVQGGPGADTITASNSANDTLGGGKGPDVITGGSGDDLIDGGQGDDFLIAGSGNDTLYGGLGNDTLRGGTGIDVLDGGAGTNALHTGPGDNVAFYAVNGISDQIFAASATNDSLFYSTADKPIIETGSIAAGNKTLVA